MSSRGSARRWHRSRRQVRHNPPKHTNLLMFILLVRIQTTKESIRFSVAGEIASGSVTVKASLDMDEEANPTVLEIDEPVNSAFALRYLNLFNKAASLSPTVCLKLSADTPIVVEFKIAKLGSLKYFLAPKIDDEADDAEF